SLTRDCLANSKSPDSNSDDACSFGVRGTLSIGMFFIREYLNSSPILTILKPCPRTFLGLVRPFLGGMLRNCPKGLELIAQPPKIPLDLSFQPVTLGKLLPQLLSQPSHLIGKGLAIIFLFCGTDIEIGRASCRERVYAASGAGQL